VQAAGGDVIGEIGELLRGHAHGFERCCEQGAVRLADERAYPGDAEPGPGQRGGQASGQGHVDEAYAVLQRHVAEQQHQQLPEFGSGEIGRVVDGRQCGPPRSLENGADVRQRITDRVAGASSVGSS